jgi:Flp pilus assembly pilin Flp
MRLEIDRHRHRAALARVLRDDRGAMILEYGLIVALIAVVCIASFTAVGGSSGGSWDNTADKVSEAMNKN